MSLNEKILYITPYLPFPNNKAANLFISKRIELLSKKFDIELLSITNGNYSVDITNHRINNYLSDFDYIFRKSVTIKSILKAIFTKETLFNILSQDIINNVKSKIKLQEYKLIIIEHSYLSSMIIEEISEISPKIVTVFHNIETDYFYDLYQKTSFLNPHKYFYYIEYKGCKKNESELLKSNSKAFWFLSRQDLEFVREKSNNKNLLLSTTISFNLKKHTGNIKKYDLLYMGQLDNQRNLHGLEWFLKNVWRLLEDNNLSFAIVGRGSTKIIKKLIAPYKGIDLIGEVENLDDIFSESKITVVPIFNTIGVQTKLFDALSQGNIVICTEDAIKGTDFKDNEHLLIANDAKGFEYNIMSVLNNEDKYQFMYQNLKKIQDNFRSEVLINDMLDSINEKK